MSGEDQERFEDYLELERYIEELQAGHVARPPTELTAGQARVYRMAALFRSASPEGAEPRPEFAAELQARLEQELEQSTSAQNVSHLHEKWPKRLSKRLQRVSRRALLAGGAAVAASMVIGAGVERVAEQIAEGNTAGSGSQATSAALIQEGVPTTWHFVTTVAQLGDNAVRFVTDTVVGYVIRADEDADEQDRGKIVAMSAACTHMGCIVQWQSSKRRFSCPCHEGLFSEYGKVNTSQGPKYLSPLPRLETKVEDGKIFVKVPIDHGLI